MTTSLHRTGKVTLRLADFLTSNPPGGGTPIEKEGTSIEDKNN
ncbi:hypothetical protein [Paenibacillus sp. GSMTC-2017]|nr:hypothetical protein [Paenibacillus sp. GSMTC-2017]